MIDCSLVFCIFPGEKDLQMFYNSWSAIYAPKLQWYLSHFFVNRSFGECFYQYLCHLWSVSNGAMVHRYVFPMFRAGPFRPYRSYHHLLRSIWIGERVGNAPIICISALFSILILQMASYEHVSRQLPKSGSAILCWNSLYLIPEQAKSQRCVHCMFEPSDRQLLRTFSM